MPRPKPKKKKPGRQMFGQDPTGIMQGYYERMHPTVRAMIEHLIVDPTAQLDPADMSLVWRGWVRQSAMEAIFGDVYDFEARPSADNVYEFGDMSWQDRLPEDGGSLPQAPDKTKTFRYGTWRRDFLLGLDMGEPFGKDEVYEFFKLGKFAKVYDGWGVVTEAMIMIVEGEGEARVSLRIRGWRTIPKEQDDGRTSD
jgi:hypothetical protein